MIVQLLLDMGVIYWCRRRSAPDISFFLSNLQILLDLRYLLAVHTAGSQECGNLLDLYDYK